MVSLNCYKKKSYELTYSNQTAKKCDNKVNSENKRAEK